MNDNTERTLHRPNQLEDAKAYAIVYDLLDRMNDNGAFVDEDIGTQKKLDWIIQNMAKGELRCTNNAYTERKPQPPRTKEVTPIAGKRRRDSRKRRIMDKGFDNMGNVVDVDMSAIGIASNRKDSE